MSNPVWTVEFSESARKTFASLTLADRQRIAKYVTSRLEPCLAPEKLGKALSGRFIGYWRFRVGDYRLIVKIVKGRMYIVIVEISHRSKVYR